MKQIFFMMIGPTNIHVMDAPRGKNIGVFRLNLNQSASGKKNKWGIYPGTAWRNPIGFLPEGLEIKPKDIASVLMSHFNATSVFHELI